MLHHHHLGAFRCLIAAVKVHSTVRLHLAPMCVNRHIFLNWLGEIKQFTAVFLCIPTIKLVTFRFWISGLFDRFSILHHFAGFLCQIAAVKAHSVGAIKILLVNPSQHGVHLSNLAHVIMSIVRMRDFFLHQFFPLCLRSRIMQFL